MNEVDVTMCPSCGSAQQDGRKFCDQCGTRLALACGSCGTELDASAKFCPECGTPVEATARPTPVRPAAVAERKVTSVLFGDLVGFTTLSETRDKEDVRELLSAYFEECRRIVARFGGTIEKFIGDAVMAVWGVPTAHEDDAERSVRAGLDLVRAVEDLGEDLGLPGLAMRVGIVTDEVAVTVGAQLEGMVAGDAVNTAARVQSVAARGAVWVDENTRLLTAASITFGDVGSHVLKGKAEPMPLWEARAVVAAVGGAQRADGLESPLVGRMREQRLIKELFHGVEDSGRPALVLIEGEAGTGKTRLGWEFEKYVDGLSIEVAWHAGRSLAYGEGVAFWPIAEAVRGRLGLMESDQEADPAQAVDRGLTRYVPDPDEADWLRPRLLTLVGGGATSMFDRDDLFAAWRTFFERTVGGKTIVTLVVDDAQHADEGTLAFLEHLLTNSDAPVFVMVMSRPGLLERWSAIVVNRRTTVLHLDALEQQDMAALLDGLVTGLPTEIRDALAERADGIPLYAMETVRSLIDRDLVVPRGGVYVLADPAALNLDAIGPPASLQALVAARLDGLSREQRRTVQMAGVLGATFTREALTALATEVADMDAVLTALTRLQIFGVVRSRFSSEFGQYRFLQAVVQQIAYATLSRRDRTALHLAAAAYFATLPDPGGDLAPVLAQHYLDAAEAVGADDPARVDLLDRAGVELRRAAARARALGSPGEALRYLEAAIEHAGPSVPPGLELEAARAAAEAGNSDAARARAEAARRGYAAESDEIGETAAVAVLTWQLVTRGEATTALALADPYWERMLGRPGAERALLDLSFWMIRARYMLRHNAVDLSQANIAMANAIGDRVALSEAMTSFSLSFLRTAPSLGMILLKASAEIADAEERPALLCRALANLSGMSLGNDLDAATDNARRALVAANKAGSLFLRPGVTWNMMVALVQRGDWAEVDQLLTGPDASTRDCALLVPVLDAVISKAVGRDRTVAWSSGEEVESDDERDLAYVDCQRMLMAAERGELTAAAEHGVASARRWAAVEGYDGDFAFLWSLAADVAAAADSGDLTERALAVVDEIPPGLLPVGVAAHHARLAATAARRTGDDTAAEAHLRDAIDRYTRWGSSVHRARAQAELANLLQAQQRTAEAALFEAEARTALEKVGARGWLAELGWLGADAPVDLATDAQ